MIKPIIKNKKLYHNNIPIEIDIIKGTTNIEETVISFDTCMDIIMQKYDGQDSIKSKKITEKELDKIEVMIMEEYKVIYDFVYKRVLRIDGLDVIETYYRFIQNLNGSKG